ncbi:MAG: glycosyltransferase family 39 protein [Candidatus Moraniibacteriota bacterium]
MNDKIYVVLLLLVAFFIYLAFGLHHLSKFETADERYWMYEDPENGRIHAYWNALRKGNLEGTHINDKPGVSLAYISGSALFFKARPADGLFTENTFERSYDPSEVEWVHFLFRFPLLLFNGLFCFLLFWLIWKFTENRWIALWAAIFILLSPILLGISQIVNPDSLLWSFSAGSIFSFFSFLKTREKKFIFLAALFLGFSLLSKYSAVILIPFLLAVVIFEFFFKRSRDEIVTQREISRTVLAYLMTVVGAFAVFSLFLPAVFVRPILLYDAFLDLNGFQYVFVVIGGVVFLLLLDALAFKSKLLLGVADRVKSITNIVPKVFATVFFIFFAFIFFTWMPDTQYGEDFMKNISFDLEKSSTFTQKSLPVRIVLEMMPLIFSLTPLTFFSLLFILGKSSLKSTTHVRIVFSVLFFLVAFYSAVLAQNLLVTIRYNIMLYPFVLLLASIGLWEFFSWKWLRKISKKMVTVGILIISFWSLWSTKPYYFNYTSDLLPKSRIITDAWGYGGYEAAEYLNALPNAKNLLIWTDYNGYCPFLVGRCVMGKSNGRFKLKEGDTIPDYFVKTRRGAIMYRGMWDTINAKYLYEKKDPAWELVINGRTKNYVRIFKYVPGNSK